MLENLNQISLGIFFLYFVLISGSCSKLLNCGLQRYIDSSVALKHILIFLSIYIFTFILNWYTIDSLVVEKFENTDEEKPTVEIVDLGQSYQYLLKSFLYSIGIYLVFLLSTKTEGLYLMLFLLFSIIMVFLQIFLKAKYGPLVEFISMHAYKPTEIIKKLAKEEELPYDEMLVNINRAVPGVYVMIGILLIVGVGKYFIRQRKDHSKQWNTMTFLFGNNNCRAA